jgi:hypothetical protein
MKLQGKKKEKMLFSKNEAQDEDVFFIKKKQHQKANNKSSKQQDKMLHLKKNKDDIGMQARNKHEKVNRFTLLFFLKTKKQCSMMKAHTHTQRYTSK